MKGKSATNGAVGTVVQASEMGMQIRNLGLDGTRDTSTTPSTSTSNSQVSKKTQYEMPTVPPATPSNITTQSKETGVKQTRPSDSTLKTRDTSTTPSTSTSNSQVQQSCPLSPIIQSSCRKFGLHYEPPREQETRQEKTNRRRRNQPKLKAQQKKFTTAEINQIPEEPPLTDDEQFNRAMDSIKAFEIEQMSYSISFCSICCERRIQMKMSKTGVCQRCHADNSTIKMFSEENMMNPRKLPPELKDLTVVEQQLISKISPCINVHLLKHGGIGSTGHCVTFPQEVNEPAQIFPRLPQEINIIKVRKQGKNDTTKDFNVRRFKVQSALEWFKQHNPAYSDIIICLDRLRTLPFDGQLNDIHTLEYNSDTIHSNDRGPAADQVNPGDVVGESVSSVLLPDLSHDIQKKVENVVQGVVGEHHGSVTVNRRGTISIPWPTRGNIPLSEFTTCNFFTLAFPALFPYGTGDFHSNRPRTCQSMADWAEHLLWYDDGRFARHPYFKFVVHNMIMRKRAVEQSSFVVRQQLGDEHLTVTDLKAKLQSEGDCVGAKIMYFGANLRGTSQYWARRAKELRALVQFKINEGSGLPSFFTTGSCAEFHFKPLRRLLGLYLHQTTGTDVDLGDKSKLFQVTLIL